MDLLYYYAKSSSLALAIVAVCVASTWAQSVTVTTVDGRTLTGELTTWTATGVEISADTAEHKFTPAELLAVRVDGAPAAHELAVPYLELSDESRFAISEVVVADRLTEVKTPLADGPLTIPAEQVRLVQLVDVDAALPAPEATGDGVAILKNDSTGTEVLTGIIGNVTRDQIEFTWDGDTIPVKRSKIAALSFFGKSGPSGEPLCYVSLVSGARLAVKDIHRDADALHISTVAGIKLRVDPSQLVEADYSVGKLVYMSDLAPLKSQWTPLVEMPASASSIRNFGAPRMNASFTGSPLTLVWPDATESLRVFHKGLALRSRTELAYRLPPGMRRFVATAGIDPETRSQGHVVVRVEADGETLFEQPVEGTEPPVEIDVDVAGKQRLTIFVDYGENLDLGDRLHLVEARVIK